MGGKLHFVKGALSSVLQYIDAVLAELYNISESITSDICDNPGVLLNVPPLVVSKIFEHKLCFVYLATPIFARDPDTCITEADNINMLFACHISKGPNMLIDAPAI